MHIPASVFGLCRAHRYPNKDLACLYWVSGWRSRHASNETQRLVAAEIAYKPDGVQPVSNFVVVDLTCTKNHEVTVIYANAKFVQGIDPFIKTEAEEERWLLRILKRVEQIDPLNELSLWVQGNYA